MLHDFKYMTWSKFPLLLFQFSVFPMSKAASAIQVCFSLLWVSAGFCLCRWLLTYTTSHRLGDQWRFETVHVKFPELRFMREAR